MIDSDPAAFDFIVAQIAFWSEFFSKLLGREAANELRASL